MLIVASIALVAICATALWYSPLPIRDRLGFRNFFGAALLSAWLAAAGVSALQGSVVDQGRDDGELISAMRSVGSVDWTGERSGRSAAAGPTASADAGAMEVASVESLIGGLESRLAAGPTDANGWALLAQSYAFVGRADQAEAAVERAVELGFDEAALRERVDGAVRDTHPGGNWIEKSLRR